MVSFGSLVALFVALTVAAGPVTRRARSERRHSCFNPERSIFDCPNHAGGAKKRVSPDDHAKTLTVRLDRIRLMLLWFQGQTPPLHQKGSVICLSDLLPHPIADRTCDA